MTFASHILAVALAVSVMSALDARGSERGEAPLSTTRTGAWTPPRVATETVSCLGEEGVAVSFATSASRDRPLAGPVRVTIGGETTTVPALQVTRYLNVESEIAITAFRPLSSRPVLAFRTKLVSSAAPGPEEAATYAGMVSLNGGAERRVICSAVRRGASAAKA